MAIDETGHVWCEYNEDFEWQRAGVVLWCGELKFRPPCQTVILQQLSSALDDTSDLRVELELALRWRMLGALPERAPG